MGEPQYGVLTYYLENPSSFVFVTNLNNITNLRNSTKRQTNSIHTNTTIRLFPKPI